MKAKRLRRPPTQYPSAPITRIGAELAAAGFVNKRAGAHCAAVCHHREAGGLTPASRGCAAALELSNRWLPSVADQSELIGNPLLFIGS
jgi:hypothetical protein